MNFYVLLATGNDIAEAITGAKVQTGGIAGICGLFVKNYLLKIFATHSTIPSLTVEKQKNGCKASKINACSRFLFRNDMCYCAIFFTLW